MRRPQFAALAIIVSLATAAIAPSTARAQGTHGMVSRLAWLAGCWERVARGGQSRVEEQWMAPRAGTMLGMGRTVRNDTTLVEFEHLRLFEKNGRVVYHAEPSGQAPAEFEASGVSDTLVVFENPTHDFPQRIIYRKRGADSLLAHIEGKNKGAERGIDFPYARASCPTAP
jgi:hypothetical protein